MPQTAGDATVLRSNMVFQGTAPWEFPFRQVCLLGAQTTTLCIVRVHSQVLCMMAWKHLALEAQLRFLSSRNNYGVFRVP